MGGVNRVVVVGGGPAGREVARCTSALGADVVLVTRSLDPTGRLDHAAVRFLAEEAGRVSLAWEPEGPFPGSEYAPALRESLLGALDISAECFRNSMAKLQEAGVRVVEGHGRISAPDIVEVQCGDRQSECIECSAIILATGTESYGGFDTASPPIVSPFSIPSIESIPESIVILGSSPVALELAYFFMAYGVFVTVVGTRRPVLDFLDVELRDAVVGGADENSVRILADVTAVSGIAGDHIDILLSDGSHIDADCVLPCREGDFRTEDLGLDGPGVLTGPDGEILVDGSLRTNIPEIYAVGSVTGCVSPLAALVQARYVAHAVMGGGKLLRGELVPNSVLFDPQIGAVGSTEEGARKTGEPISVSAVYMTPGIGPERAVKLIGDKETGRLLGLHTVGEGAMEAAHLGRLALHVGASLDDLAELCCDEGTMAECIAAAASHGQHPLPESAYPIVGEP